MFGLTGFLETAFALKQHELEVRTARLDSEQVKYQALLVKSGAKVSYRGRDILRNKFLYRVRQA